MSWFRSSRRRRSEEPAQAAAPPPAPAQPRPARAEIEALPLADLHALAAEHSVPRFRLLRRPELVAAISGEEAPARPARERPARRERPAGREEPSGRERPARREERAGREEPSVPDPDETAPAPSPNEGRSPEAGPALADLPMRRPSRALRAAAGPDAFGARMAELVAPLARGQRALIAGPPGAGATMLLRELAAGLARTGAAVIVALVDVRPEEVPEWTVPAGAEVHAAAADRSPAEQVALAEQALDQGRRLAESGANAVVVLDSISRLARAYGLVRTRAGEDAPTPELVAVEGAKRWLAAARDTGTGSLTLLAAARVDTESPLETLVHETVLDAASAVVRLDPELAARGMHPAIDARRSRTLGEEALLPASHRAALETVRGVMRSLDPVQAWEFAAARVRETRSNDELLEQTG